MDSGRNVLLTGIPVSGKSTLLMQSAVYYETESVKLFEDVITVDKAKSIANSVGPGDRLIVFVDNVGDSIDSLNILTGFKGIQVVGADRSVNIGFGSHRFDVSRFVQVDCSDLQQGDFVKIFDAIPPAIRKERMIVPAVEAQHTPSVFEFIEANVQGQSISDRYKDVLRKLRSKQVEIHDLFVMICYVFSCHAPVSYEVVSRFMAAGADYKAVYDAINHLGQLLGEVDTADAQFLDLDDAQDHFVPRSSLISETVIEMCRDDDFRRMYLRFHSSVPRLFIPRFSNFRRYGYRSGLVERVFPVWHEGENFYLRAYEEDRSYFLKQQLAIYLGIKKQYELAFKYIDEALTESRNRNPNIRHTHARLLFDANIEKAVTEPSLQGNLRKSMEILESCHEYDKRQTNHAIRFAEQSLKYASVFPGFEATSYMKKASGWLSEEIAKLPSLRHAKILNSKLSKQLGAS
jgi:tetratricopeptide (TPR) repeat protein